MTARLETWAADRAVGRSTDPCVRNPRMRLEPSPCCERPPRPRSDPIRGVNLAARIGHMPDTAPFGTPRRLRATYGRFVPYTADCRGRVIRTVPVNRRT